MRIDIGNYLSLVLRNKTWLQLADIFLLLPIAGIAIYSVKKWSYPVFISIIGWTIYSNYEVWRAHPDTMTLPVTLFTYGANLAIVSYFLIPAVRAAYFNPRLRWWENKPRYKVNLEGMIKGAFGETPAEVVNLSEGGAFVSTSAELQPEDKVDLHFNVFDRVFGIEGRVVYRLGSRNAYGVQFILTPEIYANLKRVTQGLERMGVQRQPEKVLLYQSLREWAKTLVTTGKGLVPEIMQLQAQTVAAPKAVESKDKTESEAAVHEESKAA